MDKMEHEKLVIADLNTLNALVIEATTSSHLLASTLDMAKRRTKKHRSRFIRSENVAIHAGAPPPPDSSCFFLAITVHHLELRPSDSPFRARGMT